MGGVQRSDVTLRNKYIKTHFHTVLLNFECISVRFFCSQCAGLLFSYFSYYSNSRELRQEGDELRGGISARD